jgi:Flp pilus assembly pilin Flp
MRKVSNRRGQSILEYLLVVSLIIAALVAVRTALATNTGEIMTNASDALGTAAGDIVLPTEGSGASSGGSTSGGSTSGGSTSGF